MATKPLTSEAIALTEKKMDMSLDDIIKMSKDKGSKVGKQRVSNRNQKFVKNAGQDKSAKVRRFLDTRSSVRQGALAQRRSKFQGNQFPLAAEAARRAAVAPITNRVPSRGRAINAQRKRFATPVQRKIPSAGGFTSKQPQQQVNMPSGQRPQTLDSRFASMKEQRMRVNSQQQNAPRRNGSGQQRPPWVRGRFAD